MGWIAVISYLVFFFLWWTIDPILHPEVEHLTYRHNLILCILPILMLSELVTALNSPLLLYYYRTISSNNNGNIVICFQWSITHFWTYYPVLCLYIIPYQPISINPITLQLYHPFIQFISKSIIQIYYI